MNRKYVPYYDLLNICACFAVVCLHTNSAVWSFSYDSGWIGSMVIETVFYWAVPVFLMISGATLIDYRERYSTKEYFKKRISKTVIPYLIWSAIAIGWCVFARKSLTAADISSPIKIINIIMTNGANSVYWFFPVLFAIYMCIPVLGMIPGDKRLGRRGGYTYLIIISLVTISALPLLCRLLGIQWNGSLRNPMCGGYLVLPLLGYYIANTDIRKRYRVIIYILGIAGWGIHFGGTIYLSYKTGMCDSTFKDYVNLPAILQGAAIMVAFKYMKLRHISDSFIRIIRIISGASFGVYLAHYYFIDIALIKFNINNMSWQWKVFGPFGIYLAALICVLICRKIPLLKKIVP